MIYLVSTNESLLKSDLYKPLSVEESINIISECEVLQYDSETTGLTPSLNKILTIQFGNDAKDFQIVVDCTTVDIMSYKNILESKFLIGHNLKFDLQFLYNHSIIPRRVWDTMIVEQYLHLGYPKGSIGYSLQAVADRRLSIYINKEVRGQIIYKGLTPEVIEYAGKDVLYLEKIAKIQKEECTNKDMLWGAIIECNVVPSMAYLEWCGIKIDKERWERKMKQDQELLDKSREALDDFIINDARFSSYVNTIVQQDLFQETSDKPEVLINWSSSRQVIDIAKKLGFDTNVLDKKTGEEKESVLEKHLKAQKGINDTFLKLYFDYQGYAKLVSSFGQTFLDSINPITNRIHTRYNQIGTSTGRMSSGGGDNAELSRYKHLSLGRCKDLNFQQLPHDPETRACFIAEEGNLFCSVDYDGMEARLGAIVYEEPAFIEEFLQGSGDMHSVWAKYAFPEELKDVNTKDIKKLYPDLRQKAKAYGFDYCRPLA